MPLVKLFLCLFRLPVFCITLKHSAFPKIALLWLQNNHYRRYFKQHNIHYPFQPHEKQAVHTFFTLAKNPSRFFPLVSTRTVLSAWKNAVATHWSQKHTPGRPHLSKAVRELILKLKKENPLWGAWRIRDELRKLSISVSHETISRILNHVAIVPYSPDMNAYAERFVRSIRQECLDYFVIFTYGQLQRIIKSYIEYYNNYRPHQGLKGIPNGSLEHLSKAGEIKQKPVLFGLHNHYYREAA